MKLLRITSGVVLLPVAALCLVVSWPLWKIATGLAIAGNACLKTAWRLPVKSDGIDHEKLADAITAHHERAIGATMTQAEIEAAYKTMLEGKQTEH